MSTPELSKLLETDAGEPPGRGLSCRHHARDRCTVLTLSGEVDEVSVPMLRAELEAAVDMGGDKVVIDLADVTFLGCAGVGEIVQAMRRTGWARGSICLTAPTERVRAVLELTRVGTVCPIFDSVDAAVARAHG